VMARVEAKIHRVSRWRTSDQKLRWCASALWTMERQFRRVKNYRYLPLLTWPDSARRARLCSAPAAIRCRESRVTVTLLYGSRER
jgi:hypothetical protein